MRGALRLLVLALAVVLVASPALAHRLKLFATVGDGVISGYGFFIGGGRPQGATIVIRDAAGAEVWRGATGADGTFAWTPGAPGDFALTLDARDGHVAEATIAAGRFGDAATTVAPAEAAPIAPAGPVAAGEAATDPAATTTAGAGASAPTDPAALAALVEAAVDRAVERQTRPLLEAYAEAEGRIRFNDVAGGIGMIAGLAGIALWVSSRRRPPPAGGAG